MYLFLCLSLVYTELCLTVALPGLEVTNVMHLLGRRECLTVKWKHLESRVYCLSIIDPTCLCCFYMWRLCITSSTILRRGLPLVKMPQLHLSPFLGSSCGRTSYQRRRRKSWYARWTRMCGPSPSLVEGNRLCECCFVCFSWVCIWFSTVMLSNYKRTFQESEGVGCWFDTVLKQSSYLLWALYQLNLQNNRIFSLSSWSSSYSRNYSAFLAHVFVLLLL